MLKNRIVKHIGYIINQDSSTATGDHFNLPGPSVSNLTATVLEQVKKNDQLYREEREHFLLRGFPPAGLHFGPKRDYITRSLFKQAKYTIVFCVLYYYVIE